MEELFQFITLIIMSHLFIGCAIVAITGFLLRFLSLNAVTRHNIWLGLLVILLLMPLLTFLPAKVIDEPLSAQLLESAEGSATNQSTLAVEQINREPGSTPDVVNPGPALSTATKPSLLKKLSASAMGALPLYELGIAFTLILGFGIALKLLMFIRSYRNLRELFEKSEIVNDDWLVTVSRLAAQIGARNCPAVKYSTEVDTPSTSGIFNPWIVLPAALLEANKSPQSMEQVLLHELAHIKRRDPFVASLQALVSIFMFWHPAVRYVNKQIRFERELACDDWVINHSERGSTAQVHSYANSLLEIAESLQREVSTVHSVACVHSSHGLVNRINIMLDRNVDHSTSAKQTPSALVMFSVLALLIASSPSWPKLPRVYAQNTEQETASGLLVSDALTGIARESQLFSGVEELLAEPQDPQTTNAELSQLPVEVNKLLTESGNPQQAKTGGLQTPAEVHKPLVESQGRRQLIRSDLAPQLEESIPVIEELAAISTPEETLIPLIDSENETGVEELSIELAIDDFPKLNLDSVAGVDNSEIVLNKLAKNSLSNSELENEFSNGISSQQQEPVPAAEESRSGEAMFSALEVRIESGKFIIIEDLSRSELKTEIKKIENEYFRVFNASTEEKHLKVRCGSFRPSGSFIQRRFCEPNFVIETRSENLRRIGGLIQSPTSMLNDKYAEFEELTGAMNSLLKQSRYFRELNSTLRMLKTRQKEFS